MDKEYMIQMSSDFQKLAEILTDFGINTSQLYTLSGQLNTTQSFKYTLDAFQIAIDDNEKFPKRLSHMKSATNLILYFDLDINCDCKNFSNNKDPFSTFKFNIIVKGKSKNNSSSKLIYAIHFDKHDVNQGGNQAHPSYHFQFGGNMLKEDNKQQSIIVDHGQSLFLDAPRIMHHPMELILGMDFILSNFFPTIWNKIRHMKRYKNIIKRYQKDFIVPYFKSVIEHFDGTSNIWNSQDIYPQLVKR